MKIKIGDKIVNSVENKNLMDILISNNIYMQYPCSGRGECGKCAIQVLNGTLPITEYDRKFFSDEQLKTGVRLSCKAYPNKDLEIKILNDYQIEALSYSKIDYISDYKLYDKNKYGIVIDIGTTTIAAQLLDLNSYKILKTYTCINSQTALGADVISRIEKALNGYSEKLKQLVRKDISTAILKLCINYNIDNIIISANTAMIHMLMGYDCTGLATFPFKPFNLNMLKFKGNELFDFNANVIIMPSVSAYIGSDILSGMLMCGLDRDEKIKMIIDIGTNGEIAIGNMNSILCTSAPAGPAFEGVNISCGTASVDGAIYRVQMSSDKIQYSTISTCEPVGICGSGIVDIVAESLRTKKIDNTGLLKDELFDLGIVLYKREDKSISFTQKDFRQIQLSKSAIRAGIEILIKEYGCNYESIGRVYIAGGFGYRLNMSNAIAIGMIPSELQNKIEIVGNSSIGGTSVYLFDKNADSRIEKLLSISKEIYLAENSDFNKMYMEYMYF